MPYLEHAGVGHDRLTQEGLPGQSGRYPWASGDSPYQHELYSSQAQGFLNTYEYYKKQGFTEEELVKTFGCKSKNELNNKVRANRAIYNDEKSKQAEELYSTGKYSNREIAKLISDDYNTFNESSIRNMISKGFATKQSATQSLAKELISVAEKTGFVDVGKGVENLIGSTQAKLQQAVDYLVAQGWVQTNVKVQQLTGVGKTTVSTLVSPKQLRADNVFEVYNKDVGDYISMTTSEYESYLKSQGFDESQINQKLAYQQAKVALEQDRIETPGTNATDLVENRKIGFQKPSSIDPSRVKVQWANELTGEKDSRGKEILISDDANSDLAIKHPEIYKSINKETGEAIRPATGIDRDGLMFIRPGAKDLDLGNSTYAQVRINVGDSHYLKGMATYGDESMFPKGVDIIFNTNKIPNVGKTDLENKLDALKPLQKNADKTGVDWTNPFGANIQADGQSFYEDKNGKYKGSDLGANYDADKLYSLNAVNKVNREGSWEEWSSALSSQMLSKQSIQTIKTQLDKTYEKAVADYERDTALTNPVIKRKLLLDDAEGFDTDAWDMKAVGFKGQSTKVILPSTTIGDDKCYCPSLKQGEKVALIRYPHAGTFEIPILTNDLSNKECVNLMGKHATDAIAISSASAEKLSGADFDGDTVTMIPLKSAKITSSESLPGMKGFDAKKLYKFNSAEEIEATGLYSKVYEFKGKPTAISSKDKQKYMGIVSNLITDMTLCSDRLGDMGISDAQYEKDITNAVKFSQVIIDAEKHGLNWKQAMIDCEIDDIKKKYQVQYNADGTVKKTGGASTIISRHKESADETPELADKTYTQRVNGEVTEVAGPWNSGYTIDKKTGEKVWKYSGRTYEDDKGNIVEAKVKRGSTKRILFEDSHNLVGDSTNVKEIAYADYSNSMKALANKARKDAVNVEEYSRSPEAYTKYKNVVAGMKADLNEAKKNAAVERKAQMIASSNYNQWLRANPDADKDQMKKVKTREISNARNTLGKKKVTIELNDERWEAIQAHAISKSNLEDMMKYMDTDQLRSYATPSNNKGLSQTQRNRVLALAGNYSNAQIADILGISASTVSKIINEN